MEAVLDWTEGIESGPHSLDTLVVVAWMGLGVRLRGKHLSVILHLEERLRLRLRLAHINALGGRIQTLQVPHGELRENVTVKVGVTGFRAALWLLLLLLPADSRAWETAHASGGVYGDSLHRENRVGIYP